TSGTDGERKGAQYLSRKLTEYGIAHTTHEVHAYLSWPRRATLSIAGRPELNIDAIPPAFGGATPAGGVTGEALWQVGSPSSDTGPEVKGKVVLTTGIASPDGVLRAERAGAAAIVFVSDNEILHEMIATTIWGTPTSESAARIPTIPVVSIKHSAGEHLKPAPGRRPPTLTITTVVDRAWANIPLVVAEVPGSSPEFVLIATHLDAWYEGMTDTAGTVASILDMARVLKKQQPSLKRGVRFAWWPGHSFGRYPGSAWYTDRFWADLDEHCVAYTNLDGSGRRGSRIDEISAGGWPGLADFSRAFAQTSLGKTPDAAGESGGRGSRVFRPGRDSDSSFQGIGVPEFFVGVPGPPRGHPEVEEAGRISYWHTAQDTLEKVDMKALELDTRYRVAQVFALARMPVLPHKIAPIAVSYERAVDELAAAAGTAFDFTPTRATIARLKTAANRLDELPRPAAAGAQERLNRLLVRVTHRLNATLYTRAGRFDQDPAAQVPILPLLARARELTSLTSDPNARGFLETELLRGRNAVESTLREATEMIEHYLGATP
ncbi:MAG: M28 family peptidase, partial [Acidobacteria bacterium]|nr:M28 family peptidase [Acidobacteriota bacterium]